MNIEQPVVVKRFACLIACAFLGASLPGCGVASEADLASASSAVAGDARNINIGFGGAGTAPADDPFQFGAIQRFFNAGAVQPGAHICHRYLSWDIGLLPPGDGNPTDSSSRANFETWLNDKSNPCTDALISFKATGDTAGIAPTDFHDVAGCATCFGTAFHAFLDEFASTWEQSAPGRVFSFTAWNEPNNGASSGNGIGHALSAVTAGQYYLMAQHLCDADPSKCKVAAGDLASNGAMIDDFQQNCASDVAATLCAQASWLDTYKHFIVVHANDPAFELGSEFRPEYWAYHPWQEINNYVNLGDQCTNDARCATMALLHSLGGSWGAAHIWDTEIGSGQEQPLDDETQAKGAAYLMKLSSSLTDRIWRIYYQGIETGPWQLMCGSSERPSFHVLAERWTSYTGGETYTCN
jgi:hypothetical protein